MKPSVRAVLAASVLLLLIGVTTAFAAPNWSQLVPFKKVEADPNKAYRLTEDNGPWLIMARSFAGETAEEEAQALVLELRQKFKLKAYVHKQHYDFTRPEQGLGVNQYGQPKLMRPQNGAKYDEIAVLVGDFQTVEDPKMQDALEAIKYARPKCLELTPGQNSSQRFAGVRDLYRQMNGSNRDKGPMRMAFITRNPMLPEEFFAPKGLDPLVLEMNRDRQYSLLKCRGAYTVRIASFQGETTMNLREIEKREKESVKRSKLEEGALKAEKICAALRAEGVEAYEFHDRHESIVTIGSFDSVGEPRPDGRTEINPAVHAIMERYKARPIQLPGQAVAGMSPTKVAGISLDVQPMPVAVPRQSFGQIYARRGE